VAYFRRQSGDLALGKSLRPKAGECVAKATKARSEAAAGTAKSLLPCGGAVG
jgi:hypothetical protein